MHVAIAESIVLTGKTVLPDGAETSAGSTISLEEGRALSSLIHEHEGIMETMEIGCAHGVSSLYICGALRDRPQASHTIVDAFQHTDWKGSGIHALNRAGLSNFKLVEERSEFALPQMAREGRQFDLVFIDGWHTFDHTLLDAFFATRMLRVGGFLAFDDADLPPVGKAVKYVSSYDCYEEYQRVFAYPRDPLLKLVSRVGSIVPLDVDVRARLPRKARAVLRPPRMVILKKVAEDERPWNWYRPF